MFVLEPKVIAKRFFIGLGLLIFATAVYLGGSYLFRNYSVALGSYSAVAYDWKKGEILNDFKPVTNMPDDWILVYFDSENIDGSKETIKVWVPTGTPEVGSRLMKYSDKGDDVTALQSAINLIRSDDKTDQYYFDELQKTGEFDAPTRNAVNILQKYFGQNQTGDADFNFQASLYSQLTSTN
jgi:hypothetical protein